MKRERPKPLPDLKRETLGQVAVVLLPIEKLKVKSPRGVPFEREIHDFLVTSFNGYTVSSGNISGHWKDDTGHDHYGEHRQYKVAVAAQEAIHCFEVFLAGIAAEMQEECIYIEIGREIYLIYASAPKSEQTQ
ncbi:MAG TPA: hypothetical protein VM735_01030 [Candidatus Kapabacteria bacterium]|nr:hypothetical protein [Candidatus Kapabacteria bacterium]